MANCKFCGVKAGWFRSAHPVCAEKHRIALENVTSAVHQALVDSPDFETRLKEVRGVADANSISVREYAPKVVEDLANIVSQRFQLGLIDRQFVGAVKSCVKEFGLERSLGTHRDTFNRLDYALVLSELRQGVLPREYNSSSFQCPVNLQKGEGVAWVFSNVKFYEDRVHSHRVGGGRGVTVKVAKGVYYHTGQFKSHTVSSVERDHIDTGTLVVATKSLYFVGASKGVRLPYNKVLSFEPFSDALGVIKDGANAKHQMFTHPQGWFLANLVQTAAQL